MDDKFSLFGGKQQEWNSWMDRSVSMFLQHFDIHLSRVSSLNLIVDTIQFPTKPVFRSCIETHDRGMSLLLEK
ncbi:hypothetical protein V6N12_058859 [Hibiscus sabdariffa]|uniref:Uncharacterized protein n=1 Tax=Hibiscus sabdariffa TaxID=183260 RepID=A0ABR2EW61_9ROSI